MLCMDDTAYRILTELEFPELKPIALEEFEKNDEQLMVAKTNRSRIEYYFTCTPSLPLFILNNGPEVDVITYLDADLFFFHNPAPLFQEMDSASIAIIESRFSTKLKYAEIYGIYNVGWLSFRRDEIGLDCLNWWKDRCIEWCYDRVENGRFAEQKYLDDWPSRFRNVKVISHKGANLAFWNVSNYRLSMIDEKVLVDEQPLLFYHFCGIKEIIPSVYTSGLRLYGSQSAALLRNKLYRHYITVMRESRSIVSGKLRETKNKSIREAQKSRINLSIDGVLYTILKLAYEAIKGHCVIVRP